MGCQVEKSDFPLLTKINSQKAPTRRQVFGRAKGYTGFAFAGMIKVLTFPDFALKRKCTLSERSEFVHFRFVFSKIR